MKYASLWIALFGLISTAAAAVELNTEAMKKMQKEGHKILEEETALQPMRLANGKCLQAAGAPGKAGVNLVNRKCNAKAKNQLWLLDEQGRLNNRADACVAVAGKDPGSNAVMKQCSDAKDQQWRLDDEKRLVNAQGLCLQAKGGNMIAATCTDNANQQWR
jgi:hypothetical protein